jgi:hypothetical protein
MFDIFGSFSLTEIDGQSVGSNRLGPINLTEIDGQSVIFHTMMTD